MLPSSGIRTPRKNQSVGKVQRYRMLATCAALLVLTFVIGMRFGRTESTPTAPAAGLPDPQLVASAKAAAPAHTLVIYIYSKTDTEYENNLLFFLKWGVAADDGCDYIFILQEIEGVKVTSNSDAMAAEFCHACCSLQPRCACNHLLAKLLRCRGPAACLQGMRRPQHQRRSQHFRFDSEQMPDLTGKLPPNARVETHPNGCYDWGTIGAAARDVCCVAATAAEPQLVRAQWAGLRADSRHRVACCQMMRCWRSLAHMLERICLLSLQGGCWTRVRRTPRSTNTSYS